MKAKSLVIWLDLLFITGCSSRAKLPPEKAMLGQWESAATRYFIGPEKIYNQDIHSGDRLTFDHKIVIVNEKKER